MDNIYSEIVNILNRLEESISVLVDAMKKSDSVPLGFDIFKSIQFDINRLGEFQKIYLGEFGMSLNIVTNHLQEAFNGKTSISNDEYSSIILCLDDVRKLRGKISYNNSFENYISDIKNISRYLSNINTNYFLKDNNVTINALDSYGKIIIQYRKIIDNINEIRSDLNISDFENFKLDLDINYNGLRANLKEIYLSIIASNNDIADPLLNKFKKQIDNGIYDSILETSMIHKVVDDKTKRGYLVNNFTMLIESLNLIVDRYKNKKINNSNTNIDIEIPKSDKKDDYGIEIPRFIEENYNAHRIVSNENNTHDSKNFSLITKFEILKRKFERKKVLTKEEVKLYNKLESELDALSRGKKSSIKFNYYYTKLNKKLKLSNKNKYNQIVSNNKKRK